MAVVAFREVLPRTFSHRFGEPPTAELKYVVTVDAPTSTQELIGAVGIFHGSPHPEYPFLGMVDANCSEQDRHHAEIVYRYELIDQDPNPLSRPDVWSFSVGGAEVPALTYYNGTGNDDIRPLTNAAHDFFEGLTTLEAEVRATIAWNRPSFPAAMAAAVTNGINDSAYLWGAKHTWQCAGISAQQQTEVVNDQEINYWSGTTELVYRARGWNLMLPHVGLHYITGNNGEKFPTYVRDAETGSDVPASTPQPLDQNGSQKYTGGTSGPPDILERRIYREVNFESYFGTPPF